MSLSLKFLCKISVVLFFCGICLSSFALPTCEVKNIIGTAEIFSNNNKISAKPGDGIDEGAEIETKQNSFIKLRFNDDSEIVIYEKSKLKIWSHGNQTKNESLLSLIFGKIKFLITPKKSLDDPKTTFKTPNAVMGIRGTQGFIISESDVLTKIAVTQGSVYLSNKKDTQNGVIVNEGFWGQVENELQPKQPLPITDEIFNSLNLKIPENLK